MGPASPQGAEMAALTPPDVWHSRPAGEGASFCVPRCRGRNGRGGGCSVVWRPCTLAGHSPLPSAPRFRGGPWGQSATLPPVPSPHRGRRFVGIAGRSAPRQTCRRHRGCGRHLGGRRVVGIASLGLPAADVSSASQEPQDGAQSLSRLAPLIGNGSGTPLQAGTASPSSPYVISGVAHSGRPAVLPGAHPCAAGGRSVPVAFKAPAGRGSTASWHRVGRQAFRRHRRVARWACRGYVKERPASSPKQVLPSSSTLRKVSFQRGKTSFCHTATLPHWFQEVEEKAMKAKGRRVRGRRSPAVRQCGRAGR